MFDESGDNKAFVATIVANVATERIWLDTTVLESMFTFFVTFGMTIEKILTGTAFL